jgi:hypothetical protein
MILQLFTSGVFVKYNSLGDVSFHNCLPVAFMARPLFDHSAGADVLARYVSFTVMRISITLLPRLLHRSSRGLKSIVSASTQCSYCRSMVRSPQN